MKTLNRWPWSRTLATVPQGRVVQIHEILFGTIRDRCWELGIRPGGVLTCRDHGDDWVEVELPSGESARLGRAYAWFIAVDTVQ